MKFLTRREFIVAGGVLGTALAMPVNVFAGSNSKAKVEDAIRKVTGGAPIKTGGPLLLKVDKLVENGAIVPVTLVTKKGFDVVRMALVVDDNPVPLIFSVGVDPALSGDTTISTRIKMKQTSIVRAFATDSKGNVYMSSRPVTITIGGCG
ncbi:hypothetical protein MNBD_NITROSPINAE01-670 [hydrothermal vent metagenome]|uniref:Ig-like SoxY domain-containing protein n=1 Tax=hydrothermal vent metagenome TaxID=652676 RepID=A0A3B1C7X8_9ZZZZ